MTRSTQADTPPGRTGVLNVLLFSWANNVWFGVTLLVCIFTYSSLGSAIPALRQYPFFDMTEMGWFHWWPFDVMMALLCVNIITVTLKQIPLRLVNAGVWMIHTGILVLCLGSVYYFGTKVEGDAPVYRRQVVIEIPGQDNPARMIVRPDSQVTVGIGADAHHFTIAQIIPDWTIVSGDDAGKEALMIWVDCVTPKERFTRQLLVGFPQYTEDILPDRTRAKKTLGRPLVDETIHLSLDYVPQNEFFVMDTSALYSRATGAERWLERPIADMPRYHERINSYDDVHAGDSAAALPLRTINIEVPATEEPGDPLAEYDVRVVGYLRYAFMSTEWGDGGTKLNPVADVTLSAGPEARLDYQLIAFDPARSQAESGQLMMRWIDSEAALEQLVGSAEGTLVFNIPERETPIRMALDDVPARGEEAEFTELEDTGFAFRIKHVIHNLVTQSGEMAGRSMSIATLEIKTPNRTLTRFVSDVPGASRDLNDAGLMQPPDTVIAVRFNPGVDARLTLMAGPAEVGTHLLLKDAAGQVARQPISPGQTVSVTDQVSFTLHRVRTHAVEDIRPRIVPIEQRDRGARASFSMMKLAIRKGDWSRELWLDFNSYALPNRQYAIPRRMGFHPTTLTLADGQTVELMYSRERHPLPTEIALDSFELATHSGGYTGSTNTVRDFISQLRFKTVDGWSDTMQMSSNRPASTGGFWFFQSTWDPPGQGYAGMNYTGIGVGNRNGVYIQLAGTCIAVAGMIFAFYVKPMIRRRMQERASASRASKSGSDGASRTGSESLETVGSSQGIRRDRS